MKKISGVIFDMDGLIFDTETVYSRINVSVAPEYGMTGYNEDYYLTEVGIGEQAVYQKYLTDFSHLDVAKIEAFIKETRTRVWEEFQANGAPLKPGAMELLIHLKENHIPRVISSSNSRAAIDLLLEKADIRHYFDGIVSGDDVAHAKPDPEIVVKAVELLGTKPEETVMLEDSLNGIRASHAAKVPVIMVPDLIAPNEEVLEKGYAVKDTLHDVLEFIQSV